MSYEKNKTAFQNDEGFEREKKKLLDVNRWNRQLLGQTYYSICGDNKNLYKEVRFKNNWITDGELDAMLNEPKPCPPCSKESHSMSVKPIDIPEISLLLSS